MGFVFVLEEAAGGEGPGGEAGGGTAAGRRRCDFRPLTASVVGRDFIICPLARPPAPPLAPRAPAPGVGGPPPPPLRAAAGLGAVLAPAVPRPVGPTPRARRRPARLSGTPAPRAPPFLPAPEMERGPRLIPCKSQKPRPPSLRPARRAPSVPLPASERAPTRPAVP